MVQAVSSSIAQSLFLRLQELAETFQSGIQSTYEGFIQAAIPHCQQAKAIKPWLTPEFASLNNPDEQRSLRDFLRASFCHGSERKQAYQLASVLAMIVHDDLDFEIVRGIQFGRLIKLAYTLKWLSKADRLDLLQRARTANTFLEFEAYVESKKAGYHIEPEKMFFAVGSESAVESVKQYNKTTKQRGDNRPVIEKLADLANIAITVDPETNTKSGRILNAFCRYYRSRSPGLALDSDQDILASIIWEAWKSFQDEFDDATAREFAEIDAMR